MHNLLNENKQLKKNNAKINKTVLASHKNNMEKIGIAAKLKK